MTQLIIITLTNNFVTVPALQAFFAKTSQSTSEAFDKTCAAIESGDYEIGYPLTANGESARTTPDGRYELVRLQG